MNQLIRIEQGEVYADSRMIAEHFGKRHADVLRDIADESAKIGYEIPNFEFKCTERIFALSTYKDSTGRNLPCYTMNEEGLMQLAARYDAVARRKLIVMVKELKEKSKPKTQAELSLMMAQQMVEQERRIDLMETRVEAIKETIVTDHTDWRSEINRMLKAVGKAVGDYSKPRNESYELLTSKAKVRLSVKLENLKGRLAKEGATRSEINAKCYLDVIESDTRLKEIYWSIVTKMHVKYCA